MAVTRQMPGLLASTAADSIVVFGSATLARLSHDRTGLAFAMAGFGVVCISGGSAGAPPRPPATGAPPPPRALLAHRHLSIAATPPQRNVRFARVMMILVSVPSRLIGGPYILAPPCAHGSRNGAGPAGG